MYGTCIIHVHVQRYIQLLADKYMQPPPSVHHPSIHSPAEQSKKKKDGQTSLSFL